MYPMVKEGVSIGTFEDEDSGVTHYYIENSNGDEFEISHRLWLALLNADGTKPLDLPNEGRRILPTLKRHGLIRTSRFVREGGVFSRFIIFPISNKLEKGCQFCRGINTVLPVAAILILAISVCLMFFDGVSAGDYFNWWLYYGILVMSLTLHEIGHLIAGLAYGYKIRDTGILLLGIIPIGAYLAYDDSENDPTWKEKMQLFLAGIEVNLLVAGICFLLSRLDDSTLSAAMFLAAKINLILAGVNLLPVQGLDGEFALSAFFGVKSISVIAKKWLTDKKRRKKLCHSGLVGYICLCTFSFTLISKVLFWFLVGFNIVIVLFGLF